jgi:50S ribosomal protein L16 3-hydroxylase
MKRLGLAELLHPLSIERFLSHYWQKKPYVSHGALERFGEMALIPELASIETLLEAWQGTADAWAPRDTKNPVITAEREQLQAFYESGYTLYLSRIEDHVPALEPFSRQLELDLGLRFGDVYFEGFVSQGTGSAMHFDPNVTINIQLIGRKHWKTAENKHLINPHMGWSVGSDVPELMQGYARQPFPSIMPRGFRSFEAREGTLVYLQPGHWHSTTNHEPSLSMVYTINPPSWTELLLDEIRNELHLVDDSRELAFGLGSVESRRQNRCRIEALIKELGKVAARLDPDKLLTTWGDSLTTRFKRNARFAYHARTLKDRGGDRLILDVKNGRKTESFDLPPETSAVLKWINRRRSFSGHQAALELAHAAPELVIEMLLALEEIGVISRQQAANGTH